MLTFSVNPSIYRDVYINPEAVKTERGREYIAEVYIRSTENKLSASKVNVDAYAWTAEGRAMKRKVATQVSIINNGELNSGRRGVLEESIACVENDMDRLADSDEYRYELEVLLKYRDKCIIEEGIDIIRLLLASLKSDKVAIKRLKGLVDMYELKDTLSVLCSRSDLYGRLVSLC